jgi:hypothetical protein
MKKTLLSNSILFAALALAMPARAADSGLSLGLRTTYGIPLGTAGDGAAFADLTSGAIPVQVDLSYRISRHWLVGGYFSWGWAGVADAAKAELGAAGATEIRGHAVQRLGLQGIYRFAPDSVLVPWAGLAFGYEWTRYAAMNLSPAAGGEETEIGLGGFEGTLQWGADLALLPSFRFGPFAAFSVGQFQKRLATQVGPGAATGDVKETGLHQWMQFGLKGTFDL